MPKKITLDEMKHDMMRRDLHRVPFVIINKSGEEFHAFWLDLFMGVFIVPAIEENKTFHISQMYGKGVVCRLLEEGENTDHRCRVFLETQGGIQEAELELQTQ